MHWLVLVLAAGVSDGMGVAWCGQVPGGRPKLVRKSEFGPFGTLGEVRAVRPGAVQVGHPSGLVGGEPEGEDDPSLVG
jgi:hypothetical protein